MQNLRSLQTNAGTAVCRAIFAAPIVNMHAAMMPYLDAGTAPEQHILPSIVEDMVPGLPSYKDWLLTLHKAVLVKS